ncbi:Dna2-domain-containing protein [Artomyces pyxidatus]|uniref:Dna2-domain-containing protein n=1 Tax=Artomyces pyxidatus TaxID=48021 RepID=A0ACB8SJU5_9AGAM|nr:Dna2-domain-containing protein [Artomyces pyxidatus]
MAKPTEKEEADFMADLLSGINDSFFDAVPSPSPSPAKPPPSRAQRALPILKTPTKSRDARKIRSSPPKQRVVLSPTAVFPAGDVDVDQITAGWDWDAISDYVPTPQKPPSSKRKPLSDTDYEPEPCTRCVVISIEDIWMNESFEKHIVAETDPTREARSIILRDDWVHTDIHTGDTLNIIGAFWPSPTGPPFIALTTQENLLIHHPDVLLTPSTLASAPHCVRRPILSSMLRSSTPWTPALVYGNVLHEVFQRCLREKRWDVPWIEARVDEALRSDLGQLVRTGVTVDVARTEILKRAKGVGVFGERYIASKPKRDAVLENTRAERGHTSLLAITDLHDVEEDIWSPTYGLKGKLDASVQASISSLPSSSTSFLTLPPISRPVPLEIKTGRAVAGMEHRAQTMLYTLLMSERYGVPVNEGLLYYTQSEEVIAVPAARHEMRALVSVRNSIAEWMTRRFRVGEGEGLHAPGKFLPETINDERICGRCYAVDACMLYRKAVENVTDTNSPIAELYEQKTGHLTPSQAFFFKDWERLIALEEQDMARFKKELWTLGAADREAKGRCFADLVIDGTFSQDSKPRGKESKIHQFTYRFQRRRANLPSDKSSLLNGHMNVGDAVTVSIAPDLIALSRGYILELAPMHVVVGVDHELDISTIHSRLRTRPRFRGATAAQLDDATVFRVDKDEFSGGMGRIRDSLAALFYAGGDSTRLQLVVDLAPPRFAGPSLSLVQTARESERCQALARSLSSNQMQAVEKVLCAQDYALILGMPGTGKTTVVARLIQMLVEMGKTVLLTAYTHSAVDTILGKLTNVDFGILRLGNTDKVHPDLRKFTLSARRHVNTVEELERQLMTPPVVATTALSIDHRDARKGGLDVSLFRRLSEAHPNAVVGLTQQYRMNEDIMLLSNKLVYGDRLRCGTDKVAKQTLNLPDRTYLQSLHTPSCSAEGMCWMEQLMDPHAKAVFINTDRLPALDSRVGDLVQNTLEATLVCQIVETLLYSGVREEQLGVITMYRQQIKLISHLLLAHRGVEILTADRSQGRDKDCIVISMVRSNDGGQIGDLVRDWRRLNVAFTRARSKLVIIGSRSTLERTPLLQAFFTLMDSHGWLFSLPPKAHLLHTFPDQNTSGKRTRDDTTREGAEDMGMEEGPGKRLRVGSGAGLLRGRPILKDVYNDSL